MKRLILVLMAFVSVWAIGTAEAQFPRLGGGGGGGLDGLVSSFVISYQHTLEAQENFALALGLQDEVALMQAERQALSTGTVNSNQLQQTQERSAQVQVRINEAMERESELSPEAKEHYSKGLVSYFLAILTARQVVMDAQSAGRSVRSNPLSAGAGVFVVQNAPGYLQGLVSNGRMMLDYGRRNGIEGPPDATSLL